MKVPGLLDESSQIRKIGKEDDTKIKHTRILILLVILAFLLTACNVENSPAREDSPTSTAEDSPAPDVTMPVPIPDSGEATISEPGSIPVPEETPDLTPTTPAFIWPTSVNVETKQRHDEKIFTMNERYGIDIDSVLSDIEREYGQYLNNNICKDAVRVALVYYTVSVYSIRYGSGNLAGVSDDALIYVNDFLRSQDEQPLKLTTTDHYDSIAALWLAASLYYDPNNRDIGYGEERFDDIAIAFGLAWADSVEGDAERCADSLWSGYAQLFSDEGLFDLIE